jgi:hypothetical protein
VEIVTQIPFLAKGNGLVSQALSRHDSLLFLSNWQMMDDSRSLKRKAPALGNTFAQKPGNAKRIKASDARVILAQASDKALNQNGELDVSAFVKAREYEIRALEDAMVASRKAAATRAFQQVPRALRRRTASHNVKRVPKRLRKKAAKEVSYPLRSILAAGFQDLSMGCHR